MSRFFLAAVCAGALFQGDLPTWAGDVVQNGITLVESGAAVSICVDARDEAVVGLAAGLLADDIRRVTGLRPQVGQPDGKARQIIIAGTLGHSAQVDALAARGKLGNLDAVKGHWETTLSQMVEDPFPGVERALVIAGSDRRGIAYGLMRLSEQIGVSPWLWWADVPVKHRDSLSTGPVERRIDAPGVKYRGFFINDEDWGIIPWASKTFDPAFGNIGPKTYEKIFELMLRLRLNYLWPAMHSCSTEFGAIPENSALADRYAIVMGASHCEQMLYNNVNWKEKEKGPWNYSLNRDAIHACWENTAKARGAYEGVWTLGTRGVHDIGMEEPPHDMPDKIRLLEDEIFPDQEALIRQYISPKWGPVARCFVPYKEVQAIYDAGLNVPPEATLMWADDNFGYIRRFSDPKERQRPGGSGVYWHVSFRGGPHCYLWINTTAPAFMWEELHKAWENEARTMWVLNVGDIKPMEIGIDYFSRLAWDPEKIGPNSQPAFLRDFAERTFGKKPARAIADLLAEYYTLGTIRKPELMNRAWALALPPGRAEELNRRYQALLERNREIEASLPPEVCDAYVELVGFPAWVVGAAGSIFMADRNVQLGKDAEASQSEVERLRSGLEAEVTRFNTRLAGGKWNHMMPGLQITSARDIHTWSSEVRWPWGEPANSPQPQLAPDRIWLDAASATRALAVGKARWTPVPGLGTSGKAVVLTPATVETSWKPGDPDAPALEYEFEPKGEAGQEALIDFLPTFRLCPGMKLCVAVSVDSQPPSLVEIPGSNGKEEETGPTRSVAVLDNCVTAHVPLPALSGGKHLFKIRAVDPGVIIDRISFQ
jgi:hypothetical protein